MKYLILLFLIFHISMASSQNPVLEEIVANNQKIYSLIYTDPNEAMEICIQNRIMEKNLLNEQGISRKLAKQIAHTENMSGIIYFDKGLFAKANEYYFSALRLYTALNDTSGLSNSYNNIGGVFLLLTNYEKAHQYFNQSLEISQKNGNKKGLANAYGNIGNTFRAQNENENAETFLLKELELRAHLNDSIGLSKVYNNIGSLYNLMGDFEQSMHYLNKSIQWKKALGLNSLSYPKIGLAEAFYKSGQIEKAENLLLITLPEVLKQENYNNESRIYTSLISIYHQTGNEQQELFYSRKSLALNARVDSIQTSKQPAEYEFLYLTEKKEHEIKILHAENKLKSYELQSLNRSFYVLFIGSILLLLFGSIFYFQFKNQKRTNQFLVKKNMDLLASEEALKKVTKAFERKKKDPKYSGSGLDDLQKSKLKKALLHLMHEERIFVQSELTLNILAKKLGINRTHLSQLINDEFGKNFNVFINEYRVKEVQKLLAAGRANIVTIESIALEVGFSSKSTFNSTFKKYTGITPSFYLKQLKSLQK